MNKLVTLSIGAMIAATSVVSMADTPTPMHLGIKSIELHVEGSERPLQLTKDPAKFIFKSITLLNGLIQSPATLQTLPMIYTSEVFPAPGSAAGISGTFAKSNASDINPGDEKVLFTIGKYFTNDSEVLPHSPMSCIYDPLVGALTGPSCDPAHITATQHVAGTKLIATISIHP